MKLELVNKFTSGGLGIYSAVSLNEDTTIFLSYSEDNICKLLLVTINNIETLDLGNIKITDQNYPVLFSMENQFGIIKNKSVLLLFSKDGKTIDELTIENTKILPEGFFLSYRSPVSDSNALPVVFESQSFISGPRYFAFLKLDIVNKKAQWESWTSLDNQLLIHHQDKKYPPKLDSLMIKKNDLYVFSSGGKNGSVNKWGMDYFVLVKSDIKGTISEVLLDSGNLELQNPKKRGVNGSFSSSKKYLILTPVFQTDEWKGKQKMLDLKKNELIDFTFSGKFGKYPRLIQHFGDYFWVYLWDSKEIAIFKEK